jgi:hypothetical protein
MINKFYRAAELDVHIAVDADEAAFVLCLAPFKADYDFFVDPWYIFLLAGFGECVTGSRIA